MTEKNTTTLNCASLSWNETNTPISTDYDDVYFSKDDGAAESDYVFIQQNNLAQRFSALFNQDDKVHFNIGETGFGTGLNFLQCCALWQASKERIDQRQRPNNKKLFFFSTERHPLTKADLIKSLAAWPDLNTLSHLLIENYPPPIKGLHSIQLTDDICLTLLLDDVITGFKSCLENDFHAHKNIPSRCMDAWFLDGFSPAKNPSMWTSELFQLMASLSHNKTTLSTFTAAGFVRRGLMAAGFDVKKVTGYGKKRDMLSACYRGLPCSSLEIKPRLNMKKHSPFWPIYRNDQQKPYHKVLVIGAGIAGCTTSALLSKAGFDVTLMDLHSNIMQEASGNSQAVLFPKLSHQEGHLSQFNLFSFLYARRFYQQPLFKHAFHPSGMLQILNKDQSKDADKLIERFNNAEDIVQFIHATQASDIADTTITENCLWYPTTGWLRTSALAEGFHSENNFHFKPETQVENLYYQKKPNYNWSIHYREKQQLETQTLDFDAVVIANAFAANSLLNKLDNHNFQLPLKNIRGQITQVATQQVKKVKTTICHKGYICPTDPLKPDTVNFGASYDLRDHSKELLKESQQKNVAQLATHLADFEHLAKMNLPLAGQVNFRCTTPDYLPMVGPVPRKAEFQQQYKDFQKTSKAFIPEYGNYYQGLMLNVGFGSRGFASAPLCAHIIRSYLTTQNFPIERNVLQAIQPARFLIRDIIRGKLS